MTAAIFLHLLGLLVSLALGTAFCAMESAVLALNRARLLELFGSDATHGVSEQAIFRDTKETYFVSRLGLYGTLALAGFCGLRLAHAFLPAAAAVQGETASWALDLLPGAVTLLVVPPLYLFIVFAVPRLLMRPAPADPEGRLPLALRWFIRAVHPLARLSVVSSLLPLRGLLPHHQLTKSDLVSLVTDLETTEDLEEEEEEKEEEERRKAEEERIAAALTGAADGATPAAAAAAAAAAVAAATASADTRADTRAGAADGGAAREEESEEDETDEEELVYNILDLENTLARELMEPINHVIAVRLDGATVESVLELARRTGYSRFPVYHERIVDLVGYLNVYDILNSNDPARHLDSYVTPAYYVPEFMRVNQLLREFLERNIDVAVVVDEHGGSSGWVTREDVLEEIVGVFGDESEKLSNMIHEEEPGTYVVDASVNIDDLAEEVPLQFEEPQYDTLAGFILMTLGRVPEEGAVVTTDAATFTVEKMERNRVAQVRIRLHRPSDEEPAKA